MKVGVGILFIKHIKVEKTELNQAKLDNFQTKLCANNRKFNLNITQLKTARIAYQ